MITSGLSAAVPPGTGDAPGGPAPGPGPSPWSGWVDRSTEEVAASGRWRRPRTFDAAGPAGRLDDAGGPGDARPVVSFASNDYLGLATHPAVVAAAHEALDRWGAGSGASRLVTGSRPVHGELEGALASWKGCERAVVLPTGFAANLSVLSVFGTEGAHIFSDELNHASIVDGCRLARAAVTVFPHRSLGALERELAVTSRRPLIVSDTVFSMDGDQADLDGLVALARRHQALLVLDEAHAVLGPELAGDRSGGGGARWPGSTSCRWARCPNPSVRSAGSSPARPGTSSTWSTGHGPTSSPPPPPRRMPPLPWPPSG